MKTLCLSVIASFMTAMMFAQHPITLPLWPDGAPNSNQLTGAEQEPESHRITNVTNPTLTVYRPANPNGMTIIMCPGGGYSRLAMDHEGYDMAPWFCRMGITYAVLKYRMPNGHSDVPLSDAQKAISIVRQHATQWNIDPYKVGIMGASAGGHLATTLATHYSAGTRPDFQILLYPVVTMQAYTHGGSKHNLLGESPTPDQVNYFSNEMQVTQDTPQAFIVLSSDDAAVVPANGVNYYLALQANGVPTSLHVYPTGGHGWGYRESFKYSKQWTQELEKWLTESLVFPTNTQPMLRIGRSYLGRKYVANALDQNKEEALFIDPQAVDCTTFVEYVLAQALGFSFASNVQKIRYRNGVIDGYASRLHYTSDWIENGIRNRFLTDITAIHSSKTVKLALSYMSAHTQLYSPLKNSPESVKQIMQHEKALTGKEVHYLPKAQLPDTGLAWIENGDIITIQTNVRGLDVTHMGLAYYVEGKLHLLHASSAHGKVLVSEKPLSQMLNNHSSWTGIRVVRMLQF